MLDERGADHRVRLYMSGDPDEPWSVECACGHLAGTTDNPDRADEMLEQHYAALGI